MNRYRCAGLAAGLMLTAAPALAAPDCTSLRGAVLPDVHLSVTGTKAIVADGKLPGYCQLDGTLDPHQGADAKPYFIGFALALPDDWNGRFLFQGGGGLDGVVRPPLGANADGGKSALARGFAVVSTDSGHQSGNFDRDFEKDQQASLDFAQNALERVTLAAKALITRYYGRPADHSYFVGCSTGGREAMTVAERYPSYFDGVVAGSPAMRTGYSTMAVAYAQSLYNQIAPKDAGGKPIMAKAYSPADKALIIGELLKQCDRLDGVADGMISAPLQCRFNPAPLTCKGAKTDQCLSAAQVDVLTRAFAAPRDGLGRALYAAHPFDTGMGVDQAGSLPGFLPGVTLDRAHPAVTDTHIDLDARDDQQRQKAFQVLVDTYGWTDLSSFSGHGGKLIFYHGMSDPWFSALDTVNYYQRLTADSGGPEKAAGFSRLYLVPGMGHCQGGPATLDQFDMLSTVVDWVEKGQAPQGVTATGKDFPGRSRPLCPYPQEAHYTSGNSEKASSFVCR